MVMLIRFRSIMYLLRLLLTKAYVVLHIHQLVHIFIDVLLKVLIKIILIHINRHHYLFLKAYQNSVKYEYQVNKMYLLSQQMIKHCT